jgi:hypothetical protein
MKEINTPIEYMESLDWDIDDLDHAKEYLKNWDSQSDEFYSRYKKIIKHFDLAEREHYRNCVNFWEKKLNENPAS